MTRGHFDRLGVRVGSRCWEVGAGGPGIQEALAAAVGPTRHVLATDIDPSWLKAGDGYEVRRHDVAVDPPPEPGTFDLVHARLVLVHVPDRAHALATMAAALRPGGWLLVEDADTALRPLAALDDSGPAQQRANRLRPSRTASVGASTLTRRSPRRVRCPRRRSAASSVVTSSCTKRTWCPPSSPAAPCRASLALSTTTVPIPPVKRRPVRTQAASARHRASSVTWCGSRRTATGQRREANTRRAAAASAAVDAAAAASSAGTFPVGAVTRAPAPRRAARVGAATP
ncbi:class I SAM-dependent methyltransferase [Streptomyces sp. NPDC003753]